MHRSGNEVAWWRKLNINPLPIALKLWQHTRTDGDQSDPKLWKNVRLDETNRFHAGNASAERRKRWGARRAPL
jgi:hypothetical protein